MLRFMGSQRVRHDWVTELKKWTDWGSLGFSSEKTRYLFTWLSTSTPDLTALIQRQPCWAFEGLRFTGAWAALDLGPCMFLSPTSVPGSPHASRGGPSPSPLPFLCHHHLLLFMLDIPPYGINMHSPTPTPSDQDLGMGCQWTWTRQCYIVWGSGHGLFSFPASFWLELELSFWTTRWKPNAGDARISHCHCIGFNKLTLFLISSLTGPQCMWVLKRPPLDPVHSQSFVWLHIYNTEVTLLTWSMDENPR